MIFNAKLGFRITNISRIILSQYIKSLNLHECAISIDMRKSVILLILATALSATGCDFFRVIAGRPTSKDIDAKRVQIMKAEEAALQARLDSIRRCEEKIVSDSLAALDSLASQGVMISDASRLGGLVQETEGPRYRIVIGVFRDRANALKLASEVEAGGYAAELLDCKRGLIAVGVCPSDRIARTFEDLNGLRSEQFCPKDSWILLSE